MLNVSVVNDNLNITFLLTDGKESRAAWVLLVMGLFWALELQPLPVVALIPIVFYPLFSIMSVCLQNAIHLSLCMLFIIYVYICISINLPISP